MNERIKELAEKCYEKHQLLDTYEFNKEKFAELIVRECADLFEVEYGKSEISGYQVATVLKEHFGVDK
jgi:hypothetical protein